MRPFKTLSLVLLLACFAQEKVSESSASEGVRSSSQAVIYPFVHPMDGPGSLSSLRDLSNDFWSDRGIPVGGARLVMGWVVWIQNLSEYRELRAWDGEREITLLDDKDWPLPMLRLGFLSGPGDNKRLNLYSCAAFGGGCEVGAAYSLDFEAQRALALSLPLTETDRNRDFPFGITTTFSDEKWFAFLDGLFWARVPAKGRRPLVITCDGLGFQERFDALFAGDPDSFPIGDHLVMADRRIVYLNAVPIRHPRTGELHESLWHLLVQDAARGQILKDLLGSWQEALSGLKEWGISEEGAARFRHAELSTEWVPVMGIFEDESLVEIVSRNASSSRIKLPTGTIEVPNSRVRPVIPFRPNPVQAGN